MARDSDARARHAPVARGHVRTGAWRAAIGGTLLAALLAACGGANEQDASADGRSAPLGGARHDHSASAYDDGQGAGSDTDVGGTGVGGGPGGRRTDGPGKGQATSRSDAFRLLTQATFGPTEREVEHVMTVGAEAWIDEQLAKPVRAHNLARWMADNHDSADGATSNTVVSSFYQEALQDDDQLRQRATFALSQVFVVSMVDLGLAGSKSESVASYLDTLARHAFGTYRDLLGAVATHPAMGVYLSSMANRAENPRVGRIPDQNFAREVMQLFSIGLVELNNDGTAKAGPIYTYGPSDIDGLSRVFTGFSWAGPDTSKERFFNDPMAQAKGRMHRPMQPYAQYHSVSEKDFLGTTIPAQQVPDPVLSLNTALDTLAGHPNVGPFICRQLIQRLVTSNPPPNYVSRVTAVFNDDGHGVRGNMGAVVKAILLDKDARQPWSTVAQRYGKVREPVLRLTAFLRAYGATSDSGKFLISSTDDPGTQLDQSPLRARSVFNFYRPGYVPTGGAAEQYGMALPEMQITDETSVAGYANYMITAVRYGVGQRPEGKGSRNDVQPDYSAAFQLADDPAALVDDTIARLLGHTDADMRQQVIDAVTSVVVPARRGDGSNDAFIHKQKLNRVYAAVLLVLASPEFVVQK